jgi:hypothetical protein
MSGAMNSKRIKKQVQEGVEYKSHNLMQLNVEEGLRLLVDY